MIKEASWKLSNIIQIFINDYKTYKKFLGSFHYLYDLKSVALT